MVSTEGGVEIEKVAAETPEKIIKEAIDPAVGMQGYQARKLAFGLGLEGLQFKNAVKFLMALYNTYDATDASIVEINPLVVTKEGDVIALDAKMNFDDNALYRHKDIVNYRDFEEEEPLEIEASKYDLNYIKLDGNSLAARIGIYVAYRSNVAIHHVTIEDFNYNGIYFYETHNYWAALTYDQMTGNSVRYCTITNSSIMGGPSPGGAIKVIANDGLVIEYNTIDQTDRAEGSNGNCILGVWNKRLKIRHNTMTKLDYNASAFNFFVETWNNMGDYDINDNTFYGLAAVAPGGVFNAPAGDCTYGVKIYNNQFLNDTNAERTHNAIESTRVAIVLEGNLWEDVYIYNNLIQRFGWGIEISTPTSESGGTFEEDWVLSNINIYYNIIEGVGYTDFNYTHGIIWVNETNTDGYTHETDGLYIYNNVITGMTGTTYSGVQINANGTLDNVAICNNITYNMDSYGVRLEAHASDSLDMTNCDVTYNDFYGVVALPSPVLSSPSVAIQYHSSISSTPRAKSSVGLKVAEYMALSASLATSSKEDTIKLPV